MALIFDGTDYYKLLNCMYKCKHFKTIRSRYFKENLLYRFQQEILVFELVQESRQRRYLFRYNKRCSCRITKSPNKLNNSKSVCNNENDDSTTINCHLRGTNCSSKMSASMIAQVWYDGSYAPPVTVQRTEKTTPFNRQCATVYPSWWLVTTSSLQFQAILSIFSTSYSLSFPMAYDIFDWVVTEKRTIYCDISTTYLKNNIKDQINLLTYKQTQPLTHQHHGNLGQSIDCYLMMMFVMVIKEIIRHLSDSFNRMRRKTQFLLPILILLQLLMTTTLTNCTSPPNQTISSAFVQPVALVSEMLPTSVGETLPSSSITTSTSSTVSNHEETVAEPRFHQHQILTDTGSSHRPTGGSSITSYISYKDKTHREPGLRLSTGGCHSCQMREQVKADNLESIKRHILMRLEMRVLPNITAPTVPHTIIESFYKNHSYYHDKKYSSVGDQNPSARRSNSAYITFSMAGPNGRNNISDKNKNNENNMQGDDPNVYAGNYNPGGEEDDDNDDELFENNFDDEFFSIVHSVYVFPTMPRMRHNRKTEILNFQFKTSEHSIVSQALLHMYIRGIDWIREYEPNLLDANNSIGGDLIISINRVVRRVNSTIATHTVKVTESKNKIPNGLGQWISVDLTQLVQSWLHNTTTNQGIVIKGSEGWMKPLIITGDSPNNKAFTVYIEVLTKDNRKRRTKRNTSMNCSESDNEERCCRYPLVVNFVEFDWTWVVAPTSFNAYFCNGECKLGFLEKYPHTHLMQLSTAPQPCCSPTKMSPLRLLYFNTENILVMSTIPNMAVEKCSCS